MPRGSLRAITAGSALFIVAFAASAAAPPLEQRLERAREIRAQSWYVAHCSLLDDVLWSREGTMLFRDRANAECRAFDARAWKFVVVRPEQCQLPRDPISRAPDDRHGLTLVNGNLHLTSSGVPESVALTTDGGGRISYGSVAASVRGGAMPAPKVAWSGNGRYALVSRADTSGLKEYSLVEWLPQGKFGARPKVTTTPRAYFGDEQAVKRTLYLVDTSTGRIDPVPDSTVADGTGDPVSGGYVQFTSDNRRAYYIRASADFRSARLIEVDLRTLASRTVLTESAPDGGFLYFSGQRNPAAFRILAQRNAVIWYSERDGYGHLYLFALDTGKLIKQLTRGEWTVLTLDKLAGRELYLTGTSAASSSEPYDRQLYVLDLDTGRIQQRTETGSDHAFVWSPSAEFFVQSSASIKMPPALRVVSVSGKRVPLSFGMTPAAALERLQATSFRAPERFKVTSSVAGRTVFGTIHFPSWMQPDDKLPVIEKIYPGYCCVVAPWAFPHERVARNSPARFFEPQALAELGFVVVLTAGPGSPLRGRAYHQAQYGDGFWDPDNLDTHIDVIRQLAAKHPQMDLGRVGIYGHSGGGYAAARAILMRPDFYHSAVAMSGNHDRRLYDSLWPVLYAGHDPRASDALTGPETVSLAPNLKGNLLLMHGDADESVPIDSTMQLAAALQQARKKFELQVIVGAGHGIDVDEYTREYYSSFFLRHLRGEWAR